MRSLAEWVFELGYEREWYHPIRDDFIRWYTHGYEHPLVKESISDKDLPKLAYRAGQSAKNYEPDNLIVGTFQAIENIRVRLEIIFKYMKVASLLIATIALVFFQQGIHLVIPGSIFTLATIIMGPPAFYHVIQHQLNSNIQLTRKFNRRLVKLDADLWTDRREENRAAYYLWNKSLNKSGFISVLTILMLVRALSPRVYGLVNAFLRDHLTDYVNEGIWSVSIREFKKAVHNGYRLV